MEKNPVWIWKAYDPAAGRVVAWEVADRSDRALKTLLGKLRMEGTVFAAETQGGYARCIPENQLFTGKDLTFPIPLRQGFGGRSRAGQQQYAPLPRPIPSKNQGIIPQCIHGRERNSTQLCAQI